jgi:uncharacterized protein
MKIYISWESYTNALKQIVGNLSSENFTPDIIIGIARGGMVPATMLAHRYKTRNLGVAYIQKTKSDEAFSEMLSTPIVKGFCCPVPLHEKKVLIVDCIVQTGQTMKCILDIVADQNPKQVVLTSVCTHINIQGLSYFSPVTVKSDDWVFFPWEMSE